MDIEETYEPQQQNSTEQHQMQCDPLFTTNSTTVLPINSSTNISQPITTTVGIMDTNNLPISLSTPSVATPLPLPSLSQSQLAKNTSLPTNDYDIDSLLLQQFSCMGTTDHEDLISQFQSLMNHQMNRESARFYLEMSNWNLQTALGCYLDFCSTQTIPSMKILQRQQVNIQQQGFRMQNDGSDRWPSGCFLTSPLQTRRIDVPSLRPGETCDIIADLIPMHPPIMWRLCTPNGWYFGDTIWMIPPGIEASSDELQQRMLQLITSETKPEHYPQINVVIKANNH